MLEPMESNSLHAIGVFIKFVFIAIVFFVFLFKVTGSDEQ